MDLNQGGNYMGAGIGGIGGMASSMGMNQASQPSGTKINKHA